MKKRKSNTLSTQKRVKSKKSFFSFLKPLSKKYPGRIGLNLSQKIFLAVGLVLFGVGIWIKIAIPPTLSFTGEVRSQVVAAEQYSRPVRVQIPSVSLSLPVNETKIVSGVWEVYESGVSYLTNSARPGSRGNIILYGHNTINNLGSLKSVKIGEPVTLVDEKGNTFAYKVYSIQTVNADDIEALTEFQNETVTIYTCTGFADLQRLLVKAERVK